MMAVGAVCLIKAIADSQVGPPTAVAGSSGAAVVALDFMVEGIKPTTTKLIGMALAIFGSSTILLADSILIYIGATRYIPTKILSKQSYKNEPETAPLLGKIQTD
jgi:hypothetical protein